MFENLSAYRPQALGALRIMTGLLFIPHGLQKLVGFPAEFPYPLNPLLTTAGVLEIAGGVLIVLGLLTRPTAFVLSGFMAVAYFMGHAATGGLYPTLNGGDAAILYCFVFLYLFVAGPGAWSLDGTARRDVRAA